MTPPLDKTPATHTQMDAAFTVAFAQSKALQHLALQVGKENASLLWRMGWIAGKEAGLAHAHSIMNGKAAA